MLNLFCLFHSFIMAAIMLKLIGIIALCAGVALSQFVTAPSDLIAATGYAGYQVRYKEVPAGICEQNKDVKSYSGYVDVSNDTHIFFWFFEARNGDPENAPLTAWYAFFHSDIIELASKGWKSV